MCYFRPMRSLLRLLLLWILIVSLPLRGIAAEIALPCTMAHTSAASPGAAPTGASVDPHATPIVRSVTQHHAGAVSAPPDLNVDNASHPASSSGHACCVCHVGVSAPPPFAVAGSLAARFAKDRVSPIVSFTGWIPSRLERPPRA